MFRGFIDFEFNTSTSENEIFSIGCVVLDGLNQEMGRFSSLIRLKKNTKISEYVLKLTGTSQKEVNDADDFKTVSKAFHDFVSQYSNISFFCWGNNDWNALLDTCKINDYFLMKEDIGNLTNIQSTISTSIKNGSNILRSRWKLKDLLRLYDLPDIECHKAINDALMLSMIFREFSSRGYYSYPAGFQKTSEGNEVAKTVVEDLMARMKKDGADIEFLNDEERVKSLTEYLNGEDFISTKLNRSIYDTVKKMFKESHLTRKDFNVFKISYDELEQYSISAKIYDEDNSICFAINKGDDDFVITKMLVNSTVRRQSRKVLKKMKEA